MQAILRDVPAYPRVDDVVKQDRAWPDPCCLWVSMRYGHVHKDEQLRKGGH